MSVLLGLTTFVAALLTLGVTATVFQLRASDAAGNGMAQGFLAVNMIALWLVLSITVLLTTLRQQRHPLSWARINLGSFLVFALGTAGQVACLAQLTGRNADGWYRIVLQLAVIVPPVAVLTHIAWRAFGAPVPVRAATLGVGVVVAFLSISALLGFLRPKKAEPELTADSLEYPALLIRGDSKVEMVLKPADLTSMSTNYVVNRPTDPLVADSRYLIFELRDLKLAKGSTGLLLRGQGVEPVTFRLVPYEPSGTLSDILELVLRVKYLSADPDKDAEIRRDLASAESLADMIAILSRD
jgi:hypothetical protein